MGEVLGISESLEALKAVEILVGDAKEILADGKVDVKDLVSTGPKLVGQVGTIVAGIQGAEKIPAELKDLSQEEISALAQAALNILNAGKGA